VVPIGGRFSYYTDWRNPDPVLGVNVWRTFLTQEIPPLMQAHLGSTGANTIAGLSSSGTSVLQLAIAAPGLYRGVASYSGCAQTSDPMGQRYVRTTVEVWGQGDADNMWGPDSDPEWVAQDPVVHAEGLRGLALYISNGSGLPGPHDTMTDPGIAGNGPKLANQVIIGGIIEAATNQCTRNLEHRLNQLGIPATYSFRDTGTHSWGYWEDDLHASWPLLAGAMNIPA
jgi:S-formylglutathione hydrolase FrmB